MRFPSRSADPIRISGVKLLVRSSDPIIAPTNRVKNNVHVRVTSPGWQPKQKFKQEHCLNSKVNSLLVASMVK